MYNYWFILSSGLLSVKDVPENNKASRYFLSTFSFRRHLFYLWSLVTSTWRPFGCQPITQPHGVQGICAQVGRATCLPRSPQLRPWGYARGAPASPSHSLWSLLGRSITFHTLWSHTSLLPRPWGRSTLGSCPLSDRVSVKMC